MGVFKKDPLQIITFQSYGKASHFYARGRAIEDETIDLSKKGLFKLLINSFKRFETDEIKNTRLILTLSNGRTFETITDDNGYFVVNETIAGLDVLKNETGWLDYTIRYAEIPKGRKATQNNSYHGSMSIPSTDAQYGIISDIDDTILHTGVASRFKWQLFVNTFFKGADRRSPLEGAAQFYQKLQKGTTDTSINPVYYVSHSPWNLYRYLDYFLRLNDFPKGPILLRSFSNIFKKKKGQMPQKQKEIINLLEMYSEQKFILIGDGGEHDADIYIEIAKKFPDRIKAIYVRSVKHKKRMLRIKGLFDAYITTPALLVESSLQAEEHAKENGFIV